LLSRDDPEPEVHVTDRSPKHPAASPERLDASSLRNWSAPTERERQAMTADVTIDLGWGRLIFGQTFTDLQNLADVLCAETTGKRDIALYLRDPHVLLSLAPDRLFLDPSHTYRLWPDKYDHEVRETPGVQIVPLSDMRQARQLHRVYLERGMVTPGPEGLMEVNGGPAATYFVALDKAGRVQGGILGVDHVDAFRDPEQGASFWCLATARDCDVPGIGEGLVRYVIENFYRLGRHYVDLSVLHKNNEAIGLYEKIGFVRVPVFCVKHRNRINEPYFVRQPVGQGLNPYAQIIVDEAMRRGVHVKVDHAERGFFTLTFAGHSVACRESLSELTSAVAMSRCDDKRVTRDIFSKAGLRVPDQANAVGDEEDEAFLKRHGKIVVKPARGEQGNGVSVGIDKNPAMREAIELARRFCDEVLLEELVEGDDLRVIVISDETVAAAVRRPATIVGAKGRTIEQLIERYNRRRMAATGGESSVPMDDDTVACVRNGGYRMSDVLPEGERLRVRLTANVHTGGTIEDVTDELHPELAAASVRAAKALDIPVTGLDLMVKDHRQPEYALIEANERPGLANHEPQPTAQRFIDLLFPQTRHKPA
jgi:GNAT-family acetyltransferase (TIGR03103 family)